MLHKVQDVEDHGNFVRRMLLQQSSNLAAITPNDGLPLEPIITPYTQSSGAFPAIDKKQSHAPAPQPSPVDSSLKQTNSTEHSHNQASQLSPSGNSTNEKMWIYFLCVPGVAFLLILAAVILCMCRRRGVKTIGPWTTGLSGQLQKAFVTGGFSITCKTSLSFIAMNCISIWPIALATGPSLSSPFLGCYMIGVDQKKTECCI